MTDRRRNPHFRVVELPEQLPVGVLPQKIDRSANKNVQADKSNAEGGYDDRTSPIQRRLSKTYENSHG
jgi:hypothetical protein